MESHKTTTGSMVRRLKNEPKNHVPREIVLDPCYPGSKDEPAYHVSPRRSRPFRMVSCFALFLFLLPLAVFGLDGKTIIAPDTVTALFVNFGGLYTFVVDTARDIDNPVKAPMKAALQQMFQAAGTKLRKSGGESKAKFCSANMRVILGAVEMYNMDNQSMISTDLPLADLVAKGYLKNQPQCPAGGKYEAQGSLVEKGTVNCSVHQTVENLKVLPGDISDSSSGKELDLLPQVVKGIADFHARGVFKPTGGLWLCVSSNLKPHLIIEASVKPKEFIEYLTSFGPMKKAPEKMESDLVVFDLGEPSPGNGRVKLEIRPDGILIGEVPAQGSDTSEWADFLKLATAQDAYVTVQVHGVNLCKAILRQRAKDLEKTCAANMRVLLGCVEMYNMDHPAMTSVLRLDDFKEQKYLRDIPKCPNGGTYGEQGDLTNDGKITCSKHGTIDNFKPIPIPPEAVSLPDPRLSSFKGGTFFAGGNRVRLTVSITDQAVRSQLKAIADMGLQQIKGVLAAKMPVGTDAAQTKVIIELFDQLKLAENGNEVTVGIENANTQVVLGSVVSIIGIAAAIAVPNFKKARDEARGKSCFANQRVILGAMEMYNLDFDGKMAQLDFKALVEQKYLKAKPECPEGGNYTMTGTATNMKINCSKHGPVAP